MHHPFGSSGSFVSLGIHGGGRKGGEGGRRLSRHYDVGLVGRLIGVLASM